MQHVGGTTGEVRYLEQHPLIVEMLRMLPPARDKWTEHEMDLWLTAFGAVLRIIYPEQRREDDVPF